MQKQTKVWNPETSGLPKTNGLSKSKKQVVKYYVLDATGKRHSSWDMPETASIIADRLNSRVDYPVDSRLKPPFFAQLCIEGSFDLNRPSCTVDEQQNDSTPSVELTILPLLFSKVVNLWGSPIRVNIVEYYHNSAHLGVAYYSAQEVWIAFSSNWVHTLTHELAHLFIKHISGFRTITVDEEVQAQAFANFVEATLHDDFIILLEEVSSLRINRADFNDIKIMMTGQVINYLQNGPVSDGSETLKSKENE